MDETGATEKKEPPDEARNEAPGPTAPRSGGMTEKADRVDRESPAKRNSPGPIQRVIEATIGGFFSTVAASAAG